jgi:hypothetical protein
MSGRSLTVVSAMCIVVTIALLALVYDWSVTTSCKGRPDDVRKCERPDPDIVNDLFFATQTVTTTGYGGGVNVLEHDVQIIASIGSVVGSILWALFTAGLFAVLVKPKSEHQKERTEAAASLAERRARFESAWSLAQEAMRQAELARVQLEHGQEE